MIEKLVNSKTRLNLLNLFLSHIDDRYYLRELERMLDESLSPLRRQLVKLVNMGILIVEEEANLKYYKVNKGFEGLEELKRLVLGKSEAEIASAASRPRNDMLVSMPAAPRSNDIGAELAIARFATPKQFRYDLALLSFVSIFVLITAVFVVYTNTKNMKQVAETISGRSLSAATPAQGVARESALSNGEMASKRWKVFPGIIPVLSDVETGEENSKEL